MPKKSARNQGKDQVRRGAARRRRTIQLSEIVGVAFLAVLMAGLMATLNAVWAQRASEPGATVAATSGPTRTAAPLATGAAAKVKGPENAKVTVIEYADFQ